MRNTPLRAFSKQFRLKTKSTNIAPKKRTKAQKEKYMPKKGSAAEKITDFIVALGIGKTE